MDFRLSFYTIIYPLKLYFCPRPVQNSVTIKFISGGALRVITSEHIICNYVRINFEIEEMNELKFGLQRI